MGVKNWERRLVRNESTGSIDQNVTAFNDTVLVLGCTELSEPNNSLHFEFKRRRQSDGLLIQVTDSTNYLYRKVLIDERQTGDDIITENGIKWRLIYSGTDGTFDYGEWDFWFPHDGEELLEFMYSNSKYSGIAMWSAIMDGIKAENQAILRAMNHINTDGIGTYAALSNNYVYIVTYARNDANIYLPDLPRQLRMHYSATQWQSNLEYSDFNINPGWTTSLTTFDFFDTPGKLGIFVISKNQYKSILSGYTGGWFNFWGTVYQDNNYTQKIGWLIGTPPIKVV